MLSILLLSFLILLLSMGGLAVGLFIGKSPIKGSCGGLACSNCGNCTTRRQGDGP